MLGQYQLSASQVSRLGGADQRTNVTWQANDTDVIINAS